MLTSRELERARQDAIDAGVLPGTAYIVRNTITNTNGITEETAGTVGTVACRLDPIEMDRAPALYAGEREAPRTYFKLTTPYGTDMIDGDKVTINSEFYEVLVLHTQHSYGL